jgi:hypothetical protein
MLLGFTEAIANCCNIMTPSLENNYRVYHI